MKQSISAITTIALLLSVSPYIWCESNDKPLQVSKMQNTIVQPAKQAAIATEGLISQVRLPGRIEQNQPIILTFILQNPTDAPRTFCDYHSPWEGIRNIIFEVIDSKGNEVPYMGVMVSRIGPALKNYRLVPAHSRVEANVDLGKVYPLLPGSYRVRFEGNGISGLPQSEWASFDVVPSTASTNDGAVDQKPSP